MRKTLIISALAFSLAGCAGPYGRVDYGRTALLGAGLGAGAFLLGGAIKGDQQYRRGYGYPHSSYGYGGHSRGYGGAYSRGYGGGYGGGYGYQPSPYRGW